MIQAKVVADSKAPNGERLTTLEVIMPRYILAEGKTHRVISGMLEQTTIETSVGLNDEVCLSKNSASSRAIPFNKMVKEVKENPFIPYAWQKEHKGMQGSEYITSQSDINSCRATWLQARDKAIHFASELNSQGPEGRDMQAVTKQLCNRLLEPFMYHKVLISATEWENFFNLRCPQYQLGDHDYQQYGKSRKDWYKHNNHIAEGSITDLEFLKLNKGQADIHMMFLAESIYDAINESTPKELKAEEWHIPYGDDFNTEQLKALYAKTAGSGYDPNNPTPDAYYFNALEDLRCKISIARCARLSYQTLGDNPEINYEKDLELYEVLSTSGHWSPFEHVARVMNHDQYHAYTRTAPRFSGLYTERGWCRNFKGFIQYRELLD